MRRRASSRSSADVFCLFLDESVHHADPVAFDELRRLSGQTKAPTMRWDDEILADFGADELDSFLRERGVVR